MQQPSLADCISTFLQKAIAAEKDLEIEARFGKFLDKETKERISAAGNVQFLVLDEGDKRFRFEADLGCSQHKRCNKFLNSCVSAAKVAIKTLSRGVDTLLPA